MKLKKPFRMPIIVRSEIITYEEGRGTEGGRIITKDLVWIPLKFWHYLMKHIDFVFEMLPLTLYLLLTS